MKKISLTSLLILALGLAMFSACGSGGSGGTAQPTTAVLTLSTSVTGTIPAGTTINSYGVTITLPAGVTVKTMPNSSETGTGVVAASGEASGALVSGIYSAATGTLPGTVTVYVFSATGFDAGEFCKVKCDFTAGNPPTASDFRQLTLDDATGWDNNPNPPINPVPLTSQMSLMPPTVVIQ